MKPLRIAAALFFLLVAGAGSLVYWSRGPGVDREAERLASFAAIQPGMTVAELGAGKGRLALRIARRVGRLYATELELETEPLKQTLHGLANVTVIEAGERSANLPEACCDVVYMRRVYHHLDDSGAILRGLHAALRPGGKLVIIDFLSPRWIPWLDHGVASERVAAQAASAGFVLDRRVDGWSPIDYCLLFRKPG